ncbi:MAG: hypothetical protein WDO74_34620 [Pseudomonadota bacterium]
MHPLGSTPTGIDVQDGALRLTGPDGVLDLDRTGVFTRRDQPAAAPRENPVAQALRGSSLAQGDAHGSDRLGRDALKLAVLRGFRAADGSLVVANSGRLLRIRASDGKLLDSDEHAYPGGGECSGVELWTKLGFRV